MGLITGKLELNAGWPRGRRQWCAVGRNMEMAFADSGEAATGGTGLLLLVVFVTFRMLFAAAGRPYSRAPRAQRVFISTTINAAHEDIRILLTNPGPDLLWSAYQSVLYHQWSHFLGEEDRSAALVVLVVFQVNGFDGTPGKLFP